MNNPNQKSPEYIPPVTTYNFYTMGNQDSSIKLMSVLADAVNNFKEYEELTDNDIKSIAIWFEKKYNGE